jgi:folate-binding protein YgfZ
LSTNKLDNLNAGSGRETFLTDAKGHVVAYGYVFADADSLLFQSASGQAANIISHLSKYLLSDDVDLCDVSKRWLQLALVGPRSLELLTRCSSNELPESPLREHLAHFPVEVEGISMAARIVSATRPIAIFMNCPTGSGDQVAQALQNAGARLCRVEAAEAVRIEANRPEFGRDITSENLPQEVGRDELTISFTKGCYLGQETVARIDSRGHVNKKLCGLRFREGRAPAEGTELIAAVRHVGSVTSSAYSPRVRSAVALGYVRSEQASPGTWLESSAGPAEVVSLPMRGDCTSQ